MREAEEQARKAREALEEQLSAQRLADEETQWQLAEVILSLFLFLFPLLLCFFFLFFFTLVRQLTGQLLAVDKAH